MEFDYIIAGGGAAGCLLANRLSANPAHSVLLLEAGASPQGIWTRIPVGYRYTIGNPEHDWCHTSTEPTLGGREIKHPRGKGLGGSTVINGMVAIRGQAADYDGWRDLGLPGWGWDDVLPHFKRHEDHAGGVNAFHGTGGEWRVGPSRVRWPVQDAVVQACVQAGIPFNTDFNTGDNLGVGPIQVNQHRGRRWRADDGFLQPVRRRTNLHIATGALVDRVLFDADGSRRAAGIVWRAGAHVGGSSVPVSARARREVILAAGAFGSPAILMRSGVGPAAAAAALGIPVVHHSPGVGANLQDHLQIGMRYRLRDGNPFHPATLNGHMHSQWRQAWMAARYAATTSGPLSMAPCQIGIFAKSSPEVARADLGYNVLPFSRATFQSEFDRFAGLTMVFYDLRPTSTGSLALQGADPTLPPRIRMNYLTTERDRHVAVDGILLTRRILRQIALQPLAPQEDWAGATIADDDRSGLLEAARQVASTIFHPVGTARMGADGDAAAVLDARLRVRGVSGLRVIDAASMPAIPSGNTCTPTLMLAEKGAQMVLQDTLA